MRFFFLSEDDHLVDGVGMAEALCELLDLPTQILGSEANACFEGDMICMKEGQARMVRKSHPTHWRASCCSAIIVDHAAQDISPLDWTITCRIFEPYWTLLLDALMWPSSVVVVDIRRQHTMEMVLA